MNYKQLVKSWIAVGLAVLIASGTASGIYYDTVGAFIVSAFLLSLFNALLKPLLVLFSLPFIVLTFGLGIWFINAFLLLLTAKIVDGFYVESFLSALWGALVVSLINGLATALFGQQSGNRNINIKIKRDTYSSDPENAKKSTSRRSQLFEKSDDVIDI